jgi:flagellar biosynthesis/type III secretory pathway protein FliH
VGVKGSKNVIGVQSCQRIINTVLFKRRKEGEREGRREGKREKRREGGKEGKREGELDVVAQAFNLSTQEVETGRYL